MTTVGISDNDIAQAALILRDGGVVAFPTETVYGLGADAFNEQAVARVYQVKGRPVDNPMILHVNSFESVATLANGLPNYARALAYAFWPGPMTMVINKHPSLPGWVGGHPDHSASTVAVRIPSHPVAYELIKQSGCVIAAPSANASGRPSPTHAAHVLEDFDGLIDLLIDGGAVDCGMESTVIDVTGETPVILRPGAVTAEMVSSVCGEVFSQVPIDAPALRSESEALRSPGVKYRHYAPRAPMTVVMGQPEAAATYIMSKMDAGLTYSEGTPVGILVTAQTIGLYAARYGFNNESLPLEVRCCCNGRDIILINMGDREAPQTIAKALYACLRQFDQLGVCEIFAEGIPETGLGVAVMNRMSKAAGGCVIRLDLV